MSPTRINAETITFLITDVARLLRAEFDRRTSDAGMGLTPGEARALVNAARAGPVRQAVLAERMGVEAMTLCSYVDRLEARGLVRRAPDPTDRRAKLVELTEAAEPVLTKIDSIGTRLRQDMSGDLSAAQIDEVLAVLKQLRTRLAAMRPDCHKTGAPA